MADNAHACALDIPVISCIRSFRFSDRATIFSPDCPLTVLESDGAWIHAQLSLWPLINAVGLEGGTWNQLVISDVSGASLLTACGTEG